MSFKRFEFARRWTNPLDFPTYVDDEATVRADLQAQPDEIATFFNAFIQTLETEGVDHIVLQTANADGNPVTVTLREFLASLGTGGSGDVPGSAVFPVHVKDVSVDTTRAALQVTYSDGTLKKYALPGYIPQKGVDYFTEADVAEVVGAVLEALPDGDEVSY